MITVANFGFYDRLLIIMSISKIEDIESFELRDIVGYVRKYGVGDTEVSGLVQRYGLVAVNEGLRLYRMIESARKSPISAASRAKRREWLDGRPDYPDHVLAHMEAWIEARKVEVGDRISLDDVFNAWKHAAHKYGLADYRRVGAKGFAMALRANGVKTIRYGTGIMVDGVDV